MLISKFIRSKCLISGNVTIIIFRDKMSRSPCYIDHYLRWICVLKIEVKYHIMKVGVLNFWKICFQKHSNFQICQLNDSY